LCVVSDFSDVTGLLNIFWRTLSWFFFFWCTAGKKACVGKGIIWGIFMLYHRCLFLSNVHRFVCVCFVVEGAKLWLALMLLAVEIAQDYALKKAWLSKPQTTWTTGLNVSFFAFIAGHSRMKGLFGE